MRSIIFILFLGLNAMTVQAQNLGGGLALGLNFSQVDGDNESGYRKIGLSAGGYVAFQLSERFELQPEILFDQLGSVSKNGFYSNRFNYFSLPILLNFQIPIVLGDGEKKLKIQIGPAPGTLISARDRLLAPPNDDISANFRSFELRGTVGLVFDLNYRLSACFRYGYSLLPFAPNANPIFLEGGPWHKYLQFSFRLALSKP